MYVRFARLGKYAGGAEHLLAQGASNHRAGPGEQIDGVNALKVC